MATLTITRRHTSAGLRYAVRYRLGGRAYPIEHAGTFKVLKEAKIRRDLVGGEIAAGRNPRDLLRAILETPQVRTFADTFDAFTASRVDVAEATKANYASHRIRLVDELENRDPLSITWQDVQDVVAKLAADLAASSVHRYVGTLAQVLDYAGCDPNPARDRRVKVPRSEATIPDPPSADDVAAIIANAPKRWRLALRLLAESGMRVGEVCSLEWGDLDRANQRLRVKQGKTRAARRWVVISERLLAEIEDTCPHDDRTPERRIFQGATRQALGNAMRNGCANAGIANFPLHSLRHRFVSLKLREGVPVADVAKAVGHSRQSITLDVYSHVIAD